jgi:hypothetical protein
MHRSPQVVSEHWTGWPVITSLLLYGAGALLAREMVVRWQKGWPSLLLLGASYGVIEEGLCAKSFFDPHWRAIGPLGVYGRWEDVNWIWALGVTPFHSVFSIALTIACVYLIFPSLSERVWLGRGALYSVALLFSLDVLLFLQKGNSYHVPRFLCVRHLGRSPVLRRSGLALAAADSQIYETHSKIRTLVCGTRIPHELYLRGAALLLPAAEATYLFDRPSTLRSRACRWGDLVALDRGKLRVGAAPAVRVALRRLWIFLRGWPRSRISIQVVPIR